MAEAYAEVHITPPQGSVSKTGELTFRVNRTPLVIVQLQPNTQH